MQTSIASARLSGSRSGDLRSAVDADADTTDLFDNDPYPLDGEPEGILRGAAAAPVLAHWAARGNGLPRALRI